MVHRSRRSGRIAKELDIVLLGTDTAGKVFSEQTKTVVLSRHGAGVISKYRFSPDEVLTLRLSGSEKKEAEVRLVGQIGGEPGRYVYGLAFVDPHLEFWPMEFPPPESYEPQNRRVTLECTFCQAPLTLEQDDIEEDVYSVNGNVLRFCESCGISTPWKKGRGQAAPSDPIPLSAPLNSLPSGPSAPAPARTLPTPGLSSDGTAATLSLPAPPASSGYAHESPASFESSETPLHASSSFPSRAVSSSLPAAYSSCFDHELLTGAAVIESPQPAVAPQTPLPGRVEESFGRPLDRSGRPVNRRKHMRIRVSYNACIRQGESADEIVECENVSKGGLCFHSRRKYAVDSTIAIAAPFSPGEPALFVAAKIARVEALGHGQVFRYGAMYILSASANPSN